MKDIEAYGLQINPYEPCVTNKTINNKHKKLVWHMDNLKVSHVHSFEITKFAGYFSSIYGGIKVYRGKVQKHLVMDLDYS